MFQKILIANRGEIAVRIIRSCHEMGIRAVAVYSEPDRSSLHVQMADEAYLVGPAAALESYLDQEKIISVAKKSGAEAIHPGYGFLAENAHFAKKVHDSGLKFIGPSEEAINLLGDKTAARRLAEKLDIPTIPGTTDPITSDEKALQIADEIGYPVLLKAAAGGGGKGMRLIETEEEMKRGFRSAQSESQSAFGDNRVYLEKYLSQPRHIEFQILADEHGNVIHLRERECSIQRRHQKLVEESPSVLMTPDLRQEMGEAAVRLTKAAGYQNAGTVEFLVDKDRNYYFLEMNTRLQVEHPVTEWITGVDLVKQQFHVASGDALKINQSDIQSNGHAIECRIYAEDPVNHFLPSTGKIDYLLEPSGIGVRCDSGILMGGQVYPFYDPLLSKLIVWAADREEALDRMRRALQEYKVFGVETTIPFFLRLMTNQAFRKGDLSTHFLQEEEIMTDDHIEEETRLFAAIFSLIHHANEKQTVSSSNKMSQANHRQNWKIMGRKEILT